MNKKPELNEMLEDMQHKIDSIQERMNLAKSIPFDLVRQSFPDGHWWDTSYNWEFCLPLSFSLVAEMKEFCDLQGWTIKNERQHVWDDTAKAGHFFDVYVEEAWGKKCFGVAFRSGNVGDTCQLKQIGTKEVPVYEVVCTEGATEDW